MPSRFVPPVLRQRDFALLFAAQTTSLIGGGLAVVALPFAALDLGASVGQLGLVLAAGNLPVALLALVGGAWADRLGARRVMIAADLVRMVQQAVVASLLLGHAATLLELALLSAVGGVADAFDAPAVVSLVPAAVADPDERQSANALLSMARNLTRLIGAPLGGVLVALAGTGTALMIDAATFAISAMCLARLSIPTPTHATTESTFEAIAGGWQQVRSRRWIVGFLPFLLVYFVTVLPAVLVLGPVLAERHFGGATAWGVMQGLFGLGAICGGLIALRWRPTAPMQAAAIVFAIASTQPLALVIGTNVWTVGAVFAVGGAAASIGWTLWETTIQRAIAPQFVGRVIAFDFTVSVGSLPLGMAIAGPVASAIGAHLTLTVASIVGVSVALAYRVLAAPATVT